MYYSDKQGMLAADLSVYWGNDFYLESSKGLVGKWNKMTHKKKVVKMNMERSQDLNVSEQISEIQRLLYCVSYLQKLLIWCVEDTVY